MIHLDNNNGKVILKIENGKVNALDTEFLVEIEDTFKKLENDPSCKGIIFTGVGSSFCAGVNLKKVFLNGETYLNSFMVNLSSCFKTLFEFKKPLVGAINGHALAGGCIFSSLCDYKIGNDSNSKIGITELKVGVPFPNVPFEIMKLILPPSKLHEVFYFAQAYSFEEGLKLGLLDEITKDQDLVSYSMNILDKLIAIPNETFTNTKMQIRKSAIDSYSSEIAKAQDLKINELWKSNEIQSSISQFLTTL